MKNGKKIVLAVLVLLTSVAAIGQQPVSFAWDANSEPNLAGYKLYYGTASRTYSGHVVTTNRTVTSENPVTLTNLVAGQKYYFAVTAFVTQPGPAESGYSNELEWTVPPFVPKGLRVIVTLQTASTVTGPWNSLWTVTQPQLSLPGGQEFFRSLVLIQQE